MKHEMDKATDANLDSCSMIADDSSHLGGFDVYVISLGRDIARRAILKNLFGDAYDSFLIIDAVNSRDPDFAVVAAGTRQCARSHRRPMAPSEVGCALSHMVAIEDFLRSGKQCCLILEDDVLGRAEDIVQACRVVACLPDDAIVICGGQQGLKNRKHLYGAKVVGVDAWHIPEVCFRFMSRACCYILTRASAAFLLRRQQTCLDRADHWRCLLQGWGKVYFTDLLRHPYDLGNSHLESDRRTLSQRSFTRRVWADGAFATLLNNVMKSALPLLAFMHGYERVPQKDEDR